MRKRILLFLGVNLLCLSACQKGTPLQPLTPIEGGNIDNSIPADPLKGGLKANVQAQPDPNHYQVLLQWSDELESRVTWLIRRTGSNNKLNSEPRVVGTLAPSRFSLEDKEVSAGESYQYEIGYMETGRFHVAATREISIPKDFVITNTSFETHFEGYKRLYFAKDSRLILNGETLTVDVDEVYSDNGIIYSFNESDSAPMGTAGKHAGPITIRTKRAFGKLRIVANGQRGGTGFKGSPGTQGATGPTGAAWGVMPFDTGPDGKNQIRFLEEKHFAADDPIWKTVLYCTTASPGQLDGGPGLQGTAGGAGLAGGRGGNTAPVIFIVNEPTALVLNIDGRPGSGGNGGAGGDGGPGGLGGLGNWDAHHLCPQPKNGPQGPEGAIGTQGPRGADGDTLPVCMRLNNLNDGKCPELN